MMLVWAAAGFAAGLFAADMVFRSRGLVAGVFALFLAPVAGTAAGGLGGYWFARRWWG